MKAKIVYYYLIYLQLQDLIYINLINILTINIILILIVITKLTTITKDIFLIVDNSNSIYIK